MCVTVCDIETLKTWRPRPDFGCHTTEEEKVEEAKIFVLALI